MGQVQATPVPIGTRRFWLRHFWLPAAVFLLAATVVHGLDLDRRISRAWFFDADAQAWIGAGQWWAINLIHRGGNALAWTIGLTVIGTLVAGGWMERLRPYRRKAAYLVVAMALCATVVGALKLATNVDCPRDLEGFGGTYPYVQLFEDRPDGLPRGRCFPGSHASTGFALMAFYFVLLDTRPRLARVLLTSAVALGTIYSIGQQARGSHFLSHDLTSAVLAWFELLGLWGCC